METMTPIRSAVLALNEALGETMTDAEITAEEDRIAAAIDERRSERFRRELAAWRESNDATTPDSVAVMEIFGRVTSIVTHEILDEEIGSQIEQLMEEQEAAEERRRLTNPDRWKNDPDVISVNLADGMAATVYELWPEKAEDAGFLYQMSLRLAVAEEDGETAPIWPGDEAHRLFTSQVETVLAERTRRLRAAGYDVL